MRDACEAERRDKGYCSIWKHVRHRDGRVVPDVTAACATRIQTPPPQPAPTAAR